MRIGSLCSGYGGLDMAAEALTGGRTVWVSDVDKGANKILAHRYPDVPNLGDFTVMDWSTVEPIDMLTAGYPCQPFSHAGKRAGTDDARHLWPEVLRCLTELRPPFALFENVRGHLSLGFDQVLADLASHDYDARWIVLRAADIGAPHGRARLFILASDARRGGDRWDLVGAGRGAVRVGGVRREDPDSRGDEGRASLLGGVNYCSCEIGYECLDCARRRSARRQGETLLPTPTSSDTNGPGAHGDGGMDLRTTVSLLPTPTANDFKGSTTTRRQEGMDRGQLDAVIEGRAVRSESAQWGHYAPAIHRWEAALGRPAPVPTMTSNTGNPQLSPMFVEWMMGLPEGWVCDVPGLSRNEKLKALGNGVVSQQAIEAALRLAAMQVAA